MPKQVLGICTGETYIALDGDTEEVMAKCVNIYEPKWCGFKVIIANEGEYIDPDREDWVVTSGLMDKFHQMHLRKRAQAKIERDL